MTLDANGNLFGTARNGGASGYGTVWEIVKVTSEITTLATFNGSNGANPFGGAAFDATGNLYGTTYGGGASGNGTVWEIAKDSGSLTTLVSFNGSNGANPFYAGVTLDANGNLYGTTANGGPSGVGTVFVLSPVPEPSSFVLITLGGVSIGFGLSRKRRMAQMAISDK